MQQCLQDDADPYLASHRIKLQPNGNQSISVHLPPHELTPIGGIAYGMGATLLGSLAALNWLKALAFATSAVECSGGQLCWLG